MKIHATVRFTYGPVFGVGFEFSTDTPTSDEIASAIGEIRSSLIAGSADVKPSDYQMAKFNICKFWADPVDLGETVYVEPMDFTRGMYCKPIGAAIDKFAARLAAPAKESKDA
jgi:hypothetical protein